MCYSDGSINQETNKTKFPIFLFSDLNVNLISCSVAKPRTITMIFLCK